MGENAKFDIQILVCHMYVLPLHIMILTMYNPPPEKEPRQKQNISQTTKKALKRKQWNHQ